MTIRPNVERSGVFSIADLAPWDFWAKAGQVILPPNTSSETANQIVIMKAIALRDMEAPSERRS